MCQLSNTYATYLEQKNYITKPFYQRQLQLHHSQMFFQDMYHIIFLFGKICLSILALISVCTGRLYYVTTERAYGSFYFEVKNVNVEEKLWIFLVLTSGKLFFLKFVRKVCPYSIDMTDCKY